MVDQFGNCTREWYLYFLGNRNDTLGGFGEIENFVHSQKPAAELSELRQRVEDLEARLAALSMPVPPADDLPDYLLGTAWR